MAFTGYDIFPGMTTIGVVSPAVRELAVAFNLEAISALQMPVEEDLAWTEMCGVSPAIFQGKVPIDLTALDGFEEFKGTRTYKQIEVAAIRADVNQWQRNIEFDLRLLIAGADISAIYALPTKAQALVQHARVMKARLAATIFMQGTPTTNKAKVYEGNTIPGAGLPLFSSAGTTGAHYANPADEQSRRFDNYHPAAGKFSEVSFASMRKDFRTVPSPSLSAETLGLQVTDVIGPSHMEEYFRQLAMATLNLQSLTLAGVPVAAAPTNIYAAGITPWRYWIAPQLDADPYVAANPGKHMWIGVSRKLLGARPVEMVAPTREFTPVIQFLGDGTEMALTTRKAHILADLDAGAAAGLPHVVHRYEET